MKQVVVLSVCAFVVLSSLRLEAGPFRRYPAGSERSSVPRIASSAPSESGGIQSTPGDLPPMPPDRDINQTPGNTAPPGEAELMDALERPPGCSVVGEDLGQSSLMQAFEPLKGSNGFHFEYIYTGEAFTNMRGGLGTRRATQYNGLIDFVMTIDLEEAGAPLGGTFFFFAENNHGRALTNNYVGDFQTYSNIDAPDFSQVSEFWYENTVMDDFLTFRLGRQDANAEFAVVDLGGDFINSSMGFSPTILMPSYPVGTMGISTFFQLSEQLHLKAGVFDGGANLDEFGFSQEGGVFSIFELKSTHELGGLPGDLHAGIWHHGGDFDEFPTGGTVKGNHGVYLGADQLIWRENPDDEEDDQGIGVFVQYGWTPDDRNDLRYHIGSGIVFKGLVDGRDDDILGFGYTRVKFSSFLAGQSAESAFELFYKAPVNDHLTLQPDLQFISRPNGIERDAFLAGLRFELAL
jgi:porin